MKSYKSIAIIILATISLFSINSCKKEATSAANPVESTVTVTSAPQIVSLTATKDTIAFGGTEPTVITCVASGGNLAYKWDVDLGDIFILNAENSQIRFTGSPCCIGKKYIKCKVSNDKGSILDTMIIVIRNPK